MQHEPTPVASPAPLVRVEMKSKLGLDGPTPTAPHTWRGMHVSASLESQAPANTSRARRRRKL